ncbi:MAG: hypothetical protein HXY34_03320 [Candidatus Thorarchaeota archaeon]|nr:hypothetical protein [Candidatus Thorarchaeota archaeon]
MRYVQCDLVHHLPIFIKASSRPKCARGPIKTMNDRVCPLCGKTVKQESTQCVHCGAKLDGTTEEHSSDEELLGLPEELPDDTLERRMMDYLAGEIGSSRAYSDDTGQITDETVDTLPPLEDDDMEDTDGFIVPEEPLSSHTGHEHGTDEHSDASPGTSELETGTSDLLTESHSDEPPAYWADSPMTELSPDDVREGDPFVEVAPPTVVLDEPEPSESVREHLFPREEDETTAEAMSHLFPSGRGTTSRDFVDAVVGRPSGISGKVRVKEIEVPPCPSCGALVTGDGFVYPDYVYEAMARARTEQGIQLLKSNEHEKAIDAFEKARMLYEKTGNAKLIEEAKRRVDEGYIAMAAFHYYEAERHLKDSEFEWAIVQFKKARELYMLTDDAKMRAKAAERVRDCYAAWGKALEDEGDALAKKGQTREALSKYQQSAEKYKAGDDTKRLKGLERKIRKA